MIWRFKVFFLRTLDYFLSIPMRIWRLIAWIFFVHPLNGKHKFLRYISGSLLLIIDIAPAALIFETICDLIKVRTRPLSIQEKEIAREIFGHSIPLHLVGMDPSSLPARKRKTTAYVSFHTINFDQNIDDFTFVHELVHIWQYRKHGSAYISEAIWAQKWGGGYNYGGKEKLCLHQGKDCMRHFNFEQQADIIEDYYRLKKGMRMQWCEEDEDVLDVFNDYGKVFV